MQSFDGKRKKRPYIPPTLTELSLEKAKQFIVDRAHRSDREATELLESMRQEQRQNELSSSSGTNISEQRH